ncbi:hypothetical protein XENORESO_000960 [Xenotaenia resolanae]|uniref:Uncharacterized protein n=2 Tax=Goodeidae TaxID=28758 RepID=A0ABV0W0A4_9TELE
MRAQLSNWRTSDILHQSKRFVMPNERLPFIGSSGSKAGKPPFSSTTLQYSRLTNRKKLNQQSQTSSSSHHHPGPSSIFVSDTNVTPWGGLAHPESSFTIIPPGLPPTRHTPIPPGPPPSPKAPHEKEEEDEEYSCSGFSSEIPSPCLLFPQNNAGAVSRGLRVRRRVIPQRRVPRPPRLPPLRPITNLSFSRSFTFSFFELPLHHSPHCRAERVRNLFQLLKQIHY